MELCGVGVVLVSLSTHYGVTSVSYCHTIMSLYSLLTPAAAAGAVARFAATFASALFPPLALYRVPTLCSVASSAVVDVSC